MIHHKVSVSCSAQATKGANTETMQQQLLQFIHRNSFRVWTNQYLYYILKVWHFLYFHHTWSSKSVHSICKNILHEKYFDNLCTFCSSWWIGVSLLTATKPVTYVLKTFDVLEMIKCRTLCNN